MASAVETLVDDLEYLENLRACSERLRPGALAKTSNNDYFLEDEHIDAAIAIIRWRYRRHHDVYVLNLDEAAFLPGIGRGNHDRTGITSASITALRDHDFVIIPINDGFDQSAGYDESSDAATESNTPQGDESNKDTRKRDAPKRDAINVPEEQARLGTHWTCVILDRRNKNNPTARHIDSLVKTRLVRGKHVLSNVSRNAEIAGEAVKGFERVLGLAPDNIKVSTLKWTPNQTSDNRASTDFAGCGAYIFAILDYLLSNRILLDSTLKKSFRRKQRRIHVSNMNFNSMTVRAKLQAEMRRAHQFVFLNSRSGAGTSAGETEADHLEVSSGEDAGRRIETGNINERPQFSEEAPVFTGWEETPGFNHWYEHRNETISSDIIRIYVQHEPEYFRGLSDEATKRRVALIHYQGSYPRNWAERNASVSGQTQPGPDVPVDPFNNQYYAVNGVVNDFSRRSDENLQRWIALNADLPGLYRAGQRNDWDLVNCILESTFGSGFDNLSPVADRTRIQELATCLLGVKPDDLDPDFAKTELINLHKTRAGRLKNWKHYPSVPQQDNSINQAQKRPANRPEDIPFDVFTNAQYPEDGVVDDFFDRPDDNIDQWWQLQVVRAPNLGNENKTLVRRAVLQHIFGHGFKNLLIGTHDALIQRLGTAYGVEATTPQAILSELNGQFRNGTRGRFPDHRGQWGYYPMEAQIPVDPWTNQRYPSDGIIRDFWKRSQNNINHWIRVARDDAAVLKVKKDEQTRGRQRACLAMHFGTGFGDLQSRDEQEQRYWQQALSKPSLDLTQFSLKDSSKRITELYRKSNMIKHDEPVFKVYHKHWRYYPQHNDEERVDEKRQKIIENLDEGLTSYLRKKDRAAESAKQATETAVEQQDEDASVHGKADGPSQSMKNTRATRKGKETTPEGASPAHAGAKRKGEVAKDAGPSKKQKR